MEIASPYLAGTVLNTDGTALRVLKVGKAVVGQTFAQLRASLIEWCGVSRFPTELVVLEGKALPRPEAGCAYV
jgi:hypothetical protein